MVNRKDAEMAKDQDRPESWRSVNKADDDRLAKELVGHWHRLDKQAAEHSARMRARHGR